MSTDIRINDTLDALRDLQTEMNTYALDSKDQRVRNALMEYAQQLRKIEEGFEDKIDYIEHQEYEFDIYNLG